MMKKKIVTIALFWLPLAAVTPAPTIVPKTLSTKKPAFKPKVIKLAPPKPRPRPIVAAVVTPVMQDLPLITVFNTLPHDDQHTIVIKANCLLKTFGNTETRITKVLGTVTSQAGQIIRPNSVEILQVPAGTIELWAEEETNFTPLKTEPIPFSVRQEACALVFSIFNGRPRLEPVSLLSENTLVFYNQTPVDQTLTFLKDSTFVGFTYNSKQISFDLPAHKIVSLPAPQNAASFTIGTTNFSPIPTDKTVFLLTPKTTFGTADPVITQLAMNV